MLLKNAQGSKEKFQDGGKQQSSGDQEGHSGGKKPALGRTRFRNIAGDQKIHRQQGARVVEAYERNG